MGNFTLVEELVIYSAQAEEILNEIRVSGGCHVDSDSMPWGDPASSTTADWWKSIDKDAERSR